MGKVKDTTFDEDGDDKDIGSHDISQEELDQTVYLNAIANPLAPRKLTKRIFKTLKKANSVKKVKKGVKEVQKAIRKGERGFAVLAGDVYPVDVYSHLPSVCEEASIPYCYVTSKQEIGSAMGSKRSMSVVYVLNDDAISEYYNKCFKEIKSLPLPL